MPTPAGSCPLPVCGQVPFAMRWKHFPRVREGCLACFIILRNIS